MRRCSDETFSRVASRLRALLASSQRLVVGIDVATREVAYTLNASAWKCPGTLHIVVDVFAGSSGGLVVTARAVKSTELLFYAVPDPRGSGSATLLGSLPCEYCADATWDAQDELMYVLADSSGASDDAGGSLWAISTANLSAPVVVANVTLPGSFGFPQWDPASRAVVGLSLVPAGSGFTRNVTLLYEPASGVYNATSHGAISGGFYVDLQDGPSSFDAVSGRGFYMLATGPLASFDVVTVAVDENPVVVLESPSICGFIGYCPDVFTYGLGPVVA